MVRKIVGNVGNRIEEMGQDIEKWIVLKQRGFGKEKEPLEYFEVAQIQPQKYFKFRACFRSSLPRANRDVMN
jgi:hypothetical protein